VGFAGEIVAAKVTGDGGGVGALSMEAWWIFSHGNFNNGIFPLVESLG
jgi:hypothetical protein